MRRTQVVLCSIAFVITMCATLFVFSTRSRAKDVSSELTKAKTPIQLQAMLEKYPGEKWIIVPKLEKAIIQEIKRTKSFGQRYSITKIVPKKGTNSASLTLEGGLASILIEFAGDAPPFGPSNLSGPARVHMTVYEEELLGNESIHRFVSAVKLFGYTFVGEGDEINRLTFSLIENKGYVYVRGKGRVISKEGKEVRLGY
jgi:hypothetical protein